MNLQTLDLNKMGLITMHNMEMQNIDGGGFDPVSWFVDYCIGKVVDAGLDAAYNAFLAQVAYDKTHPNTTYNPNGNVSWR